MWKVSQIVRCYKETLLLRKTRHSVFRGEPTAFTKPNTMAGHSGPCSLMWVQMGIPVWLAVGGLNHNFVQKTLCPSEEQGTGRISTWCLNRSVYLGMGEKQEQMMFGKHLLLQLIMLVHGEQFTIGWPHGAKKTQNTAPLVSSDGDKHITFSSLSFRFLTSKREPSFLLLTVFPELVG